MHTLLLPYERPADMAKLSWTPALTFLSSSTFTLMQSPRPIILLHLSLSSSSSLCQKSSEHMSKLWTFLFILLLLYSPLLWKPD